MCLFPRQNLQFNSVAYKKGVTQFCCGVCPECLSARANAWALRAVYEAKEHRHNCMCTLTYDNYARDEHGRVVGELPPDRSLHVCKRDVQLFLKRVRKKYGEGIKYILTAEYGKNTHRAHYHVIFFGLCFPDVFLYKKSKRGNWIYKSNELTKLWGHGICTVDSINITASVAKYCTKYCAKDTRCDDTFMLFSHEIGLKGLMSSFNAKSYWLDGCQYPVPRIVWQRYIVQKHSKPCVLPFSYRYVNRNKDISVLLDARYKHAKILRDRYLEIRDNDEEYIAYRNYWRSLIEQVNSVRPSIIQRIYSLNDKKYHSYKGSALLQYGRRLRDVPFYPPRCSDVVKKRSVERWFFEKDLLLPFPSCLETANDTIVTKNGVVIFSDETISLPRHLFYTKFFRRE